MPRSERVSVTWDRPTRAAGHSVRAQRAKIR